jgi:hypothetical protein
MDVNQNELSEEFICYTAGGSSAWPASKNQITPLRKKSASMDFVRTTITKKWTSHLFPNNLGQSKNANTTTARAKQAKMHDER